MLSFNATSLRSRVARRIFGVFTLCVVIPFAGLVLVSYRQVANFFNEKTERQLRALTKAAGMETYERLLLLQAALQVIAGSVESSGTIPSEEQLDALASNPKVRWEALAVVTAGDQRHRLFGPVESFPALTAGQRADLASGRALILVRSTGPTAPARIFMALNIQSHRPNPRTLIGEIKPAYLWSIAESRVLPSYIKLCALDISGVTLMCSLPEESLPGKFLQKIDTSAVGEFQWTDNVQRYHASYWTIPIKYEFQAPEWIVVLLASKEGIFASIAELEDTFVLWTAVCLGLSLLLALNQIRKRLVPVEKLQEATQRIARNDFDSRVEIRSTDEFQELAASFNAMAAQLGHQFNTLNTTAGIQRAVLSLLDTRKIAETILGRMMAVLGCDSAGLTLFSAPGEDSETTFILGAATVANPPGQTDMLPLGGGAGVLEQTSAAEAGIIAHRVEENGAPLTINDLPAHPQFRESQWLQRHRFCSCLAAPLVINGRIFGGLTFYSSGKRLFTERDVAFVMGLASEAAIAVYNSQLYERTTKQAAELEIANRVKDEFLSVMSHELRTPINVIQGYLTLIQERVLGEINPDQEQALATIDKHSRDLLTMVERIMDVMNIENGAIVTDLNEVSVPALLDDLKSQYSDPLGKEIELIWEYVPDLPIFHTDAPKLKRILQNFADNAIKFTERGRVVVAAKLSTETESLLFEVTDTGIGIAPHALPLIFQKFRQADSSATRRHEGVGLGLYIVKRLADLIGAKIEVKSRLGAGTTFTVVFPPAESVSGERPMADEQSHDQNARMRA